MTLNHEEPISGPLRQAVANVETKRRLALAANVDPSTVLRFLRGERIRIDQADRLAAVLGLELRPAKRTGKRSK